MKYTYKITWTYKGEVITDIIHNSKSLDEMIALAKDFYEDNFIVELVDEA